MNNTRRLALLGILTAIAIAIHSLEAMLPMPLPVPGVKLGLANAVTLLALVLLGGRMALKVAVVRVLLSSLIFGSFLSLPFFLSLGGGLSASLIMILCYRYIKGLSIIGVSLAGALMHNLAQLAVAGFIMGRGEIIYYLPVLLISAIPMGFIIGLSVKYLQAPLKKILNL